MPNHKPHTYSHEDVLFLKETLENIQEFTTFYSNDFLQSLTKDITRCFQILEKEDE